MSVGLHAAYCRTFDGELLDPPVGPLEVQLRAFAGRVPALLGRDALAMNALLGQSAPASAKAEFERVLLIDEDWYYIAQVLAQTPETTLIAIATRTRALAAVLAEVHAHQQSFEP